MSEESEESVTSLKSRADKRLQLSALSQRPISDRSFFTFPEESVLEESESMSSSQERQAMSQMSQTIWKGSDSHLQHMRRVTESKRTLFSRSISLSSSSASSSTVNSNSFSTLAMRRGKRALVLQPLGEMRRRLLPGLSIE